MKILIVEDDDVAFVMDEEVLSQHGNHILDRSTNINDSIELLEKNHYDLVLLDIHLDDDEEGTELVDHIPMSTSIIFTTSDPNYAIEAFEVNALDYLVKPISDERFFAALEKLKGKPIDETIAIKADLNYYKISVSSIYYIHSKGGYLTVCTDDRSYTFYGEIKRFIEKLPASDFMQCHRSFVVNLKRVTSYYGSILTINETEIPVSKQHRKEITNLLKA